MKCVLHFFRAIKKFTAGIKVDPTYVRAYVCRGEAYHKIHDVSTEVMQQMCSNLLKNYDLYVWTLQLYFHVIFFFIKFQLRAALKDFTRAIHLRPDVHHYYMYRVNILWYTCVLSSDSNTVWIILIISFTLSTPTVCDSLFFTGPASAGARKSGDGRFLCQVRNLYFFSFNQTVSENLFL